MKTKIYLGIGSNMGDRRRFISEAVDRLRAIGEIRMSDEYTSDPEGFESANIFVNVAAVLEYESPAHLDENGALALLHRIKDIERELSDVCHRNADGSYRDREIDIDIIAVEGLQMDSEDLTLPHPRAASRAFVTEPLGRLIGGNAVRELLGADY